jgi:hypothetical protein
MPGSQVQHGWMRPGTESSRSRQAEASHLAGMVWPPSSMSRGSVTAVPSALTGSMRIDS